MKRFKLADKIDSKSIRILLLSTVLITMFLFFVDEGYYNFHWMKDIFNWILFGIYAMFIFLGQLLLLVLFRKKRWLAIIAGGAAIGLFISVALIFA